MSGRHKKIVTVNSRRPINIDQVFFGAVSCLPFVLICYMGLTTTHVSGYEVNTGTLSVNHSYTGFCHPAGNGLPDRDSRIRQLLCQCGRPCIRIVADLYGR